MTEDTVGFLRRENSDLRLEVEHLREKTELMGQELAILRERDTREHYELEAQRASNAADRWRRAYNSAADRARQACGEDA